MAASVSEPKATAIPESNETVVDAAQQPTSGIGPAANAPVKKTTEPTTTDSPPEDDIDPENEVKGFRLIVLHLGLCLCLFLMGLDFNLIATAIPEITSEFSSIDDVGWYGSAYFIALCCTTPFCGKTFLLFPKKVVFLTYLAVFEIGSLVCAVAPSSRALIAGRVITGFGGAGLGAGGLTLLTTVIPLHKRAVFVGTMNSVFVVASVIGPVIAGALTQHVTWRWCFYINLPIGGFAAVVVILILHLKRASTEDVPLKAKLKGMDGLGFVLFAGSIVMLLLALQWGGSTNPWRSSVIIGLFIGFGVTFGLFVSWQLHLQDEAMIPPSLFTAHRNAAIICSFSFFANGAFQVVIYYLPLWFQAAQGVTPTKSGVQFLATAIPDVLTSVFGSGVMQQLGMFNPFNFVGAAAMSIGGGLLSMLYPSISEGHWIGYQILGGIGYSFVLTSAHFGMQASLPQKLVSLGATTLLCIISLSCTIYLSISQAVFQDSLIANLSRIVPEDTVNAVISAGATSFRSVVAPSQLDAVVQGYSEAITQTFYITAASPVISFMIALSMKWVRIKKPKKEDAETAKGAEDQENIESKRNGNVTVANAGQE